MNDDEKENLFDVMTHVFQGYKIEKIGFLMIFYTHSYTMYIRQKNGRYSVVYSCNVLHIINNHLNCVFFG